MVFGEGLEMDDFAVRLFKVGPRQAVHALIASFAARLVYLPIILQWTVVDLVQAFDMQHQLAFGIPAIHQHPSERQLFITERVVQHLAHMVEFSLAILIRVINAIVNQPALIQFWVDIHAGDHPNPFDEGMGITTVLSSDQLDLERAVVIQHRIVNRTPCQSTASE